MAISKEEVVWAYRMILGREPESEDVIKKQMKNKDISAIRETFLNSPEYIQKCNLAVGNMEKFTFFPLDLARNEIEHEATEKDLAKCIAKIKEAWSHLGVIKPHFSVLTDDKFLPDNLGQNLETFWKSGENEVLQLEKILTRHNFSLKSIFSSKICVEFGCGVGRVTTALSSRFSKVHGYDISQGHLNQASKRAEEIKLSNCHFHLCAENFLEEIEKCDFFYSRIVFQHNPPPVINQLIRNALKALKPDGIAIFQVPTYQIGYSFSIMKWLKSEHKLDMQMHCLPQHVIFSIATQEKCDILEVREDNSTGAPDKFISNLFVIKKHSK